MRDDTPDTKWLAVIVRGLYRELRSAGSGRVEALALAVSATTSLLAGAMIAGQTTEDREAADD